MADKRFPNDTPPFVEQRASHVKSSPVSSGSVVSWTDRFEGREEPHLQELIEDPIMACLLKSDGLTTENVLEVVRKIKARQNDTLVS